MHTMLEMLGALGGIAIVVALVRKLLRWERALAAARQSVAKDFYFRSVEIALRCEIPGQKWLMSRKAEIVSCHDDLTHIRVAFGPASKGTFEPRIISPEGLQMRQVSSALPTVVADFANHFIEFGRKLPKGDALSFELEVDVTALDGQTLPSLLGWQSEHRVDSLVLRIALPAERSDQVMFRIFDVEGQVRHQETLRLDPVSKECRKEVSYPKPRFWHLLQWDDPGHPDLSAERTTDAPLR